MKTNTKLTHEIYYWVWNINYILYNRENDFFEKHGLTVYDLENVIVDNDIVYLFYNSSETGYECFIKVNRNEWGFTVITKKDEDYSKIIEYVGNDNFNINRCSSKGIHFMNK